jgi:oligopeptidase A
MACPTDVQQAANGCRPGRRQGWLQAHAQDALLSAGDAVRHSSACASACTAPTSRAPPTRPTMPRALTTRPLIQEILACARKKPAAGLRQLWRSVSWCPRWPSRPAGGHFLRDLARRARPHAEKDVADLRALPPSTSWACPTRRPGTGPTSAKSSRKRATPSASRKSSSTSRRPRCWRAVQDHRNPVRREHPPRQRCPCGTPPWSSTASSAAASKLVGQFYLDQPARTGKRGGAWMDDVRTRWLRPDTASCKPRWPTWCAILPTAWMASPALLTHDDVITLFHEFGHGLHHMLTQVNERDVSGISGVEWDAVELPSQFMENFCWEWECAAHMTAHVDTGEPLPRALFDKMLAAKNFQSGMQTCARSNLRCSTCCCTPSTTRRRTSCPARLVRARWPCCSRPPSAARPTPSATSFAGGYAAGYYSYKWAEVLSADAYAAFEETAQRRLAKARNGPKIPRGHPGSGRQPPGHGILQGLPRARTELDALLRHQGMA